MEGGLRHSLTEVVYASCLNQCTEIFAGRSCLADVATGSIKELIFSLDVPVFKNRRHTFIPYASVCGSQILSRPLDFS